MKNIIKFDDYVKSFPHEIFGNLTIIKSFKEDDTFWFVGKEIQNILGFADLSHAIQYADLDSDEFLILNKKDNKMLFNDFINHYNKGSMLNIETSDDFIISKYTNQITLIKESGLYGLGMASRKSIAKEFRRAIRKDILPAIRKLFEINEKVKLRHDVIVNLNVEYQKFNSKYYNAVKIAEGGINKVIFDNWGMSMRHSEKPPSYWKKTGKLKAVELGIPESKIASGLDGMRLLAPEISCCISQHKELIRFGLTDEKAFNISHDDVTKAHFKLMIDNGIMPNEFNKKIIE